uniref:Lipase-like C-terminal domain-containing protein n=1 Tax=Aplanochytrium stocchinoi TaxID=215587 RepID=A0A7S3LRP4_9STRA
MGFPLMRIALLSMMATVITAQNPENVVVWVHGLFGGQFDGFPYASEFSNRGFHNIIASVGPVSSNWDRACELYAQIKGTVVDYGVCHSRDAGHSRFGTDYTGQGFYPQWDASQRIHFVGHSMGGQTIRMLEILLQEGSGCPEDTNPLFTGSGNWMRSVTTLSSPHDGSTLVGLLGDGLIGFLKNLIVGFAGITDETIFEALYNFKLDHWGITKQPGESFNSFWNRLESSILSNDNTDLAPFSVSEDGARKQNNLGRQTYPNTHYMSFATERTRPERTCIFWVFCWDYEVAENGMFFLLRVTAGLMGNSEVAVEKRKNDGVVHWESMKCPTSSSQGKDNCRRYNGNWQPNQWNWIDVPYFDHMQVVTTNSWNDIFNYDRSAKKLYVDHAQRIISLNNGNLANSFKEDYGLAGQVVDMSEYDQSSEINKWHKVSMASSVFMGLLVVGAVLLSARKLRGRLRKEQETDSQEEFNELEMQGTVESRGESIPSSIIGIRDPAVSAFASTKKSMDEGSEVSPKSMYDL